MKEENKNTSKKQLNPMKLLCFIIGIMAIVSNFYFIYHIFILGPIEKLLRYIVMIIFILLDILIVIRIFKNKKRKQKSNIIFMVLCLIYMTISLIGGYFINTIYQNISGMNKDYITYSTSLITLKNSELNKLEDLKDKKIGIINDHESIEGYIISQDIIKVNRLNEKNDFEEYDDFSAMIAGLYHGEIDALFISSNYEIMFKNIELYENIKSETKVITTLDKKMKKTTHQDVIGTLATNKNVTEPFTILLMGVDSEVDGLDKNGAFNGDALMLVTFNPKTLNATMLSIPRDTYVPISCFKGQIENKITHAAWYGESCMINTIQNFTGIPIDYYAKINFKGLVHLVDALGGIDVNVPQDLCTDDSNRGGEICIKGGYQHLNGEEALVLARNRKALANGDIDRGLNQQIVIEGLVNSAKKISSVTQVMDILNTVSRNMDTNFTTEQILSFYNIGKDILIRSLNKSDEDIVNMQQLFLQGTGQMIYDEGMRMTLWNYIPNKQSIADVVQEMKVNLEISTHELIKDFKFSINEDYQKTIIGKGPYSSNSLYKLLPDFTGDTKEQAQKWADNNGVKVSFETREVTDASQNGIVIEQSQPFRKRLDKLSGTVILTLGKVTSTTPKKIDCSLEENEKNEACIVPNFSKMTKVQINAWEAKLKNVTIVYEEVLYPGVAVGVIVAQDVQAGTHLKDTKKITLQITKAAAPNLDDDENEEKPPVDADKDKEDEKDEGTTPSMDDE